MLPSLMIISLGLFLPVTCDSISTSRTSTRSPIEMHLQSNYNYLQKHEKSSIDYTTCEGSEAYDSPDYKDGKKGEGCYYTHYEDMKIEEKFPGVLSCCPFHSHISSTERCQGKDKNGNKVVFRRAEVCIKPIEGNDKREVGKINLKCKTKIVKGIYDGEEAKLSTVNNRQVLKVNQKTFTNFCIGIKCDSDEDSFEHRYEACEETSILLNGTRCCGKITYLAIT